ncbi:MAG: hypothetical protein PHW60_15305 [Kiritimatiellae bacterium]|nr:hypothetical protein [Kiritimatiellia bacterium]
MNEKLACDVQKGPRFALDSRLKEDFFKKDMLDLGCAMAACQYDHLGAG